MSAEISREIIRLQQILGLQWGRARMSAEISSNLLLQWLASRLQWGRARMSAEIGPRREQPLPARGASMGPRSDERGDRGHVIMQLHSVGGASMGPRSDERGDT